MLRRQKAAPDQYTAPSPSQIPLGGDVQVTPPHARPRRKRTKRKGCIHSCLVSLRLVSDRKTLSGKRKGSTGGGSRWSFCATISLVACLFVVILGLYTVVFGMDSHNLILQATTHIDPELIDAILELRPTGDEGEDIPLLLPHHSSKKSRSGDFFYPSKLGRAERREGQYIDFGPLDLRLLPDDGTKRQIYVMVEDIQGDPRSLDAERDDDYEPYWNFDDDIERNPYMLYTNYDASTMEGRCRRTSWHRGHYSVCNSMHELDLLTNTPRFVGEGAYREVFVTEQPFMDEIEEMIFKELRWDLDMAMDDFEYVRMDAYVTERLTSNDRIVDIFGYCGLSMLTEYFAHGDIEDDVVGFPHHRKDFNPLEEEELTTYNNFTGPERLQLALDMVEPVIALHNFKDGVIVHDDIQLCQYLWTDETKSAVKLNDFNRAEIMLWDEQENKYCKYKNGHGHGDWRAPEEYEDLPLDEKIDIWSLGNNFYSLLTGVYPFFNVEKDKDIQKKVAGHKIAAIDPRYYDICEEGKLATIIVKMWGYYPEERPDIVDVKKFLQDAIVECEKEEEEFLREEELREKEEAKKRAEEEELARKRAQIRAEEEELEKKKAQRRVKEQEELAKMEATDRAEAVRKQRVEAEKAEAEKAAAAAEQRGDGAKDPQGGVQDGSEAKAGRHPSMKRHEKR